MKYQLVFAGGGAKGSYQVGVWKALRELGIEIDVVVGTSIGSINGAAFANDEFDKAYDLWTSLDTASLFDLSYDKENGEPGTSDYLEAIIKNRGLETDRIKELLSEVIDENQLRKSPIDYGLVTFSLTHLKPLVLFKKDIPQGKLVDYIMASSAVPGFKKQEIDYEHFIDGGVYDNMPINVLLEEGYKNIIAVSNSAIGVYRRIQDNDANIIIIKNGNIKGGVLDFNTDHAKYNINLGYMDCMKTFGQLLGADYYIDYSNPSYLSKELGNSEIDMLFLNIKKRQKEVVAKVIRLAILRTLKRHCKGPLDNKRAFIAAMEISANTLGIEKFEIYKVDQLIRKIIAEYGNVKNEMREIRKQEGNFFAKVFHRVWDKEKIRLNKKAVRKIYLSHAIPEGDTKIATNIPVDLLITNLFVYLVMYRIRKNRNERDIV